MQISKIGTLNFNHINFSKPKANKFNCKNSVDTFEKKNPLSFKANMKDIVKYSIDWGYSNFYCSDGDDFDAYFPKYKKLNLLSNDESHLKDVAESLCMYTNEDIKNFSQVFYPMYLDVNRAKSQKAFENILPHIMNQRAKLLNLYDIKEKLEDKRVFLTLSPEESNGLMYTIEEIERISKKCQNAKNEYLIKKHYEHVDDKDYEPYY